jgi:hypothetical protein
VSEWAPSLDGISLLRQERLSHISLSKDERTTVITGRGKTINFNRGMPKHEDNNSAAYGLAVVLKLLFFNVLFFSQLSRFSFSFSFLSFDGFS